MSPFHMLTAPAVSLPDDDVDTDIIFPARFLLITEKKGLGRYAFLDRVEAGDDRIGPANSSPILVAGRNFGCGSSREQAVWALSGIGLRAILAPSFGEIFRANCVNNGIVPGIVEETLIPALHAAASAGEAITVDLMALTISARSLGVVNFAIPPADREALYNGWNEITRILSLHGEDIAAFEAGQRTSAPWLWIRDNQSCSGSD